MESFKETQLEPVWVKALEKQGIVKPTPIQAACLDAALTGKDVVGEAKTGSGKTLAFLLPIFQTIDAESTAIQALILAPTRELALQITEEANKLKAFKPIGVLCAYGGQDITSQLKKLRKGIHLVIATPGRLLDHLRRESVRLSEVRIFVLDEVDQMLHLGFQREVENIGNHVPKDAQCLFFSATLGANVRRMAGRYAKEPVHVRIGEEALRTDQIEQRVIETTDRRKQGDLFILLERERPFMAVIFCRTKRRVTMLYEAMCEKGYNCAELHGDIPQGKREKTVKAFRNLEIQYLIATDVAARGLDIDGITHVINYDTPEEPEAYVHRIGRTGRAGKKGYSFTLVVPKNKVELKAIETKIGMTLPKEVFSAHAVDETEYQRTHDSRPQRPHGPGFKPRAKGNARPAGKTALRNGQMRSGAKQEKPFGHAKATSGQRSRSK